MSIFQNFQSLTLRLSVNASQTEEESTTLNNNFRISGNGVVLYATDSKPILLQNAEGESIPLILEAWQEEDEDTFSLIFSNDVSLTFNAEQTGFNINSNIPNSSDTLIIPYETASSYNITDVLKNRVIVKSKDKAFSLLAGSVTTNTIILSELSNNFAQVSAHEETQAFAFINIINLENTDEAALATLVSQAKNHIVRAFETSQGDISNEKFVAAYVAELALQGRYSEAIANVPASFISGNNRTYFTAPYFNTLEAMNQTLIREKENIMFSMQYSLERSILDVYKLDTFPTFLLQQNTNDIEDILMLPSSLQNFNPSVQQATGILATYITMSKGLPSSAALLEPVLDQCIEVIQTATTLNGSILNIMTDDGSIDMAFTARVGYILQKYGYLTSKPELIAGGTMFLVSSLQNLTTLTLNTLAYMYPYVVQDNPYYPHAEVMGYNDDTPIWIWNIIPEKSYSRDASGTITFHFDFPVTEIYHSIITGIEPFTDIEIYGLDYATDARFETYNAPGYVYSESTDTLLLRYRQRNELEEMKLFYEQVQATPLASEETEAPIPQVEEVSEPL